MSRARQDLQPIRQVRLNRAAGLVASHVAKSGTIWRGCARAPPFRSASRSSPPLARPAEMAAQLLFADLIGHRERVPGRGRLHLLAGDVQLDLTIHPIDVGHRVGRQPDGLARPPVPGRDDEISNVPADVVGEEILDMAQFAVGGVDMILFE